jgi:hypothetical protein
MHILAIGATLTTWSSCAAGLWLAAQRVETKLSWCTRATETRATQ